MSEKVEKPTMIRKTREGDTIQPQTFSSEMLSQAIAQAVASTMQALGQQPQAIQQTSQDARVAALRRLENEFTKERKANEGFVRKLANSPESEYVTVNIPRFFRQSFGPMLHVGVNGSVIAVPIDGRPHRVHKVFVPNIRRALDYEDEKIDFMNRSEQSDVRYAERDTLGQ